jgi:uncharacterized protein YkwD
MFRRTLAPALLVAGLLATAVAIGVGSNAAHVSAITNCDTSESGTSAAEQQMLDLFNGARQQAGLGALKFSPNLNRAAAWKSADSSAAGAGFSHTDSLGRNTVLNPPKNRAMDCGYPSWASEDIAWGYSDAAMLFHDWMNSDGHRANILDRKAIVAGIGEHGGRWTADFGYVDDSGAPPPPPQASTAPSATATPTNTPRATNTPVPTPTPTQPPLPPAGVTLGLSAGMNLITYAGPDQPVGDATASIRGQLLGVYAWNPVSGQWDRFAPGIPAYAATINLLHNGQVYYVEISAAAIWMY